MNLDKFTNTPINGDTVDYNGRIYTFVTVDNSWYSSTVELPIDPALVTYFSYGSGISVVTTVVDVNNDILWEQIRYERDIKIAELDWRYNRYARLARLSLTQIDDLTKLDTYAQALADITKQSNPYNIVWPTL